MSIGSFEKLQHIPENLEGYMHVRGSVYVQDYVPFEKSPNKIPNLSPLADLKFLHKQKMRTEPD